MHDPAKEPPKEPSWEPPRRRDGPVGLSKAEVIELCRTSENIVNEICRDLDLSARAVRRWISQAEADEGESLV
jgi:hypothetical protein